MDSRPTSVQWKTEKYGLTKKDGILRFCGYGDFVQLGIPKGFSVMFCEMGMGIEIPYPRQPWKHRLFLSHFLQ